MREGVGSFLIHKFKIINYWGDTQAANEGRL